MNLKKSYRDSAGGPMVKTPCFHCRGAWAQSPAEDLAKKRKKRERESGLPCGSVVKNPPANADIVSIPGLGRFHMSQSKGSPGATTTEAKGPRAHALATRDNPPVPCLN